MLLSDLVLGLPSYTDLLERVRRGEDRAKVVISGGVGALPALLLAALARELSRSLAVVVASEKDAERWVEDLQAAGLTRVFHAPAPTLTPYQRIPASLKARRDEFSLLTALSDSKGAPSKGAPIAAVLPARSLFTRLPDPSRFSELFVRIRRGDEVSLARLTERLTRLGYRRGDLVVETGDLAVRGGLFDVFPPDRDLAVRVELDGDRVESLRLFDPDTQRSQERIEEVALAPFAASEESEEARRLLTERIGRPPSEAERSVFAPAVSAMPAGWLEHAAPALIVLIEPSAVKDEVAAFAERVATDRDPDRDAFLPEELVHGEDTIPSVSRVSGSASTGSASTRTRTRTRTPNGSAPMRSVCPRRPSPDTEAGRPRRPRSSRGRSIPARRFSSPRGRREAPRSCGGSPSSTSSTSPRSGDRAP